MNSIEQISVEQALEKVRPYKAIIFDNDGTLVNSMPVHYTAWRDSLKHFGITFTEGRFYELAGVPANEIIHLLSKEQNKEEQVSVTSVLEHRQERLESVLKHIEKVQVVVDILNDAVQRNIPCVVASGGERGDVLASLAYAKVDVTLFHTLVTREDVSVGKPDPETFILAANKLGLDPKDCIGLEDGDKGLQALDAAGMAKLDVRLIKGYPLPKVLQK